MTNMTAVLLSLALADSTGFLLAYILNRAANEQSLSLDVNRHITFIDDSDDYETVWLTSPLWVAARLHKLDAVEMLLEYGADANVVYKGTTPLFVCLMQFDDFKSTNAVCLRITQMLLERGAETMYCYSKTGVTPLMLAASRCYPQLVEAILEHVKTADHDVSSHVMARDLQGLTAAHYAAGSNQHRVFDYTVVKHTQVTV
jgi:ankyrin repeat protein